MSIQPSTLTEADKGRKVTWLNSHATLLSWNKRKILVSDNQGFTFWTGCKDCSFADVEEAEGSK